VFVFPVKCKHIIYPTVKFASRSMLSVEEIKVGLPGPQRNTIAQSHKPIDKQSDYKQHNNILDLDGHDFMKFRTRK
jgi:hypothetical protein